MPSNALFLFEIINPPFTTKKYTHDYTVLLLQKMFFDSFFNISKISLHEDLYKNFVGRSW